MSSESRPFEAIYRELEETVQRLESGDLSLAESLALYESGTVLAEQCNALLDQAELRVRQLTARPDGGLVAQPFEGWQPER
jgi:exodeoxyribonuclease VII small subunit